MTSDLLTIVSSTVISLNLLGAILILYSGIQQQKVHYFALFILSVFTIIYQYTTWQYHLSSVVGEAVFWLKIQTSSVLFAFGAYVTVFSYWARYKKAGIISIYMICFSAILALANLFLENSLRYSEVVGLKSITLFNGDKLSILDGIASNVGIVLHFFYLIVVISLVFIVLQMFKRKQKTAAFVLISTLSIQIVAAYIGIGIDSGNINFFYIAALPFTLLTIWVCVIIAGSLDIQTKRLKIQIKKREDLEFALSKLAKNISSVDTKTFYQSMIQGIYELFQFDVVFIALQNEKGTMTSLIGLRDGEVMDEFTYSLDGTPCEIVMNKNVCVYPKGVQAMFPKDTFLAEMNINGYIGMPLIGDKDELLGLLAVLHSEEIKISSKTTETLEIFAHRAASELKRNNAEKKLRTIAYMDYNTRLPNRAKLFEELKVQSKINSHNGQNSVLMLLDLDRFTEVNKSYGYDAGEFVLKEIGARLRHYTSDDIFIARHGGDEFAVVLRNVKNQPIAMMNVHWEAIRAIISTPIMYGKNKIMLSTSMGAVIFPEQTAGKFDLVRSAETALYQAKLNGRNQSLLFDPQLLSALEKNRELEDNLANAITLDDGQLYLMYQPKTLATGELIGAEALMRWQHPVEGFISPAEFIPIAENTRLIHHLGEFLINKVCQQIQSWQAETNKKVVKISINISTSHFSDDEFFSHLITAIKKYDVSPTQIEIELTESGLLSDTKKAIEKLRQLQKLGFTIALDDFGTGYSSLSYLHNLPLDVLKIDKSFVDKVEDDSSQELIRSIISIGKNMKLDIVAEGTETKTQVNSLVSLGCEVFQGYYFSKPLLPKDFISWEFNDSEESQ